MPDAAGVHHFALPGPQEAPAKKIRKRALRVKWGRARWNPAGQGVDDGVLLGELGTHLSRRRPGEPAVRRLRLGDDPARPGRLPCRAQRHFSEDPLKRKNDPPRSNTAAVGLANRWLRFLYPSTNSQLWEKNDEIPSAS